MYCENLSPKVEIIRKLSREYADVYLLTDGLLQFAFINDVSLSFVTDGVHSAEKGAKYMGKLYAKYILKLVDELT